MVARNNFGFGPVWRKDHNHHAQHGPPLFSSLACIPDSVYTYGLWCVCDSLPKLLCIVATSHNLGRLEPYACRDRVLGSTGKCPVSLKQAKIYLVR